MLWVFTGIVALLVLLAMSTDQVQVGGAIGNTFRNAPFIVEQFYSIFWFITLLMVTAFVNSAAAREFAYDMHQIIFTKPIWKFNFLVGRFLGSVVVSTIPMVGISIGALLAKLVPWADADRFGPVVGAAHWLGLLVFALPNTFFIAAIIFVIAALTRSAVVSFLGGLGLLFRSIVASVLTQKLENEKLAAMLDPFGSDAFAFLTKYWTVADRNTHVVGMTGMLLWNRLAWLAEGVLIFAFGYWRFSFSERATRTRIKTPDEENLPPIEIRPIVLNAYPLKFGADARFKQFLAITRFEYRRLLKTVTFIVVTSAALVNCLTALIFTATQGFGLTTRPVTYALLQIIAGTLYMFLIALITFFAGVLVWEERDARTDEVQDALPMPEWPSYLAKFLALITAMASILLLVMLVAICVQAAHGYTRFQLGLYTETLLGQSLLQFAFFAVVAFLIHVVSPNKYVGYFAFIGFVIANAFLWRPLHVGTRMVRVGSLPNMTYSDFFGYEPWMKSWWWFALYWTLFSILIALASILMWQRGRDTQWKARLANARMRLQGSVRVWTFAAGAAFLLVVSWVYYNTEMLNHVESQNDQLRVQADYEKAYKRYQHLTQPHVIEVQYDIALFPATHELVMHGTEQIKNTTANAIDVLHLTIDRTLASRVELPGAQLLQDDKRLGYRILKLTTPMAPNEVRALKFDVEAHPR